MTDVTKNSSKEKNIPADHKKKVYTNAFNLYILS